MRTSDWEITAWTGAFNPDTGENRRGDQHARVPVTCTIWDLAEPKDGATPEPAIIEDFNAYLDAFSAPVRDGDRTLCFHCGEMLTGTLVDQLIGSSGFRWGLAHGEGFCSACHWPARAYHFIKDRHGQDLATLRPLILSYRPATAEERAEAEAKETANG